MSALRADSAAVRRIPSPGEKVPPKGGAEVECGRQPELRQKVKTSEYVT